MQRPYFCNSEGSLESGVAVEKAKTFDENLDSARGAAQLYQVFDAFPDVEERARVVIKNVAEHLQNNPDLNDSPFWGISCVDDSDKAGVMNQLFQDMAKAMEGTRWGGRKELPAVQIWYQFSGSTTGLMEATLSPLTETSEQGVPGPLAKFFIEGDDCSNGQYFVLREGFIAQMERRGFDTPNRRIDVSYSKNPAPANDRI